MKAQIYVLNTRVTEGHLFVKRESITRIVSYINKEKHVLCIKRRKQDIFIGYFWTIFGNVSEKWWLIRLPFLLYMPQTWDICHVAEMIRIFLKLWYMSWGYIFHFYDIYFDFIIISWFYRTYFHLHLQIYIAQQKYKSAIFLV